MTHARLARLARLARASQAPSLCLHAGLCARIGCTLGARGMKVRDRETRTIVARPYDGDVID